MNHHELGDLLRQVQALAAGLMDLMTKHSAFLSLRSAMREGGLFPARAAEAAEDGQWVTLGLLDLDPEFSWLYVFYC